MKTYVIILSKTFPAGHPRTGEASVLAFAGVMQLIINYEDRIKGIIIKLFHIEKNQ